MEKIKIENLTFTYPKSSTPALDSVNITINAGEFVTLFGKSGCGKSTLLRQLKPHLAPYGTKSGTIYFENCDIATLGQKSQAENIGFVMQNPDNQIVCDKVWHELAFALENLGVPNGQIRARVAEMAAFFGIQDWYYKDVCDLSGGQKQLLNLASVMILQPSVLILDEPTSQLDPIAAHDFLDTVSRINKELGTTVILSEHRLEEALPLSDRAIVMDRGRIIANGDIKSVGQFLKDANSDMLLSLPTPMRVYFSSESEYDTPITVRDGRQWLSKIHVNKSIKFTENETYSNNTVLKADNLWFRYEKEAPDILKGLSVSIQENELYAIVGANGAGKTTLLSALMGINIPYRGKIEIANGKKLAALPQNPQSLFVKKTVLQDLQEVFEGSKAAKEANEQKIRDVMSFCELWHLSEQHPYDLSGGEQQRAALAKVLLCAPDILLLDEPTKGLDAHFKLKLAKMLKSLQKSGVTIIMISHDIEFCAEYADRVGMFFDGHIVAEDKPRKFFSGKSFYTTAANRMARTILPDAVLVEDIVSAIGGKIHIPYNDKPEYVLLEPPVFDTKPKKITAANIIVGILFAIVFFLTQHLTNDYLTQALGFVFAGICLYNFIPKRNYGDLQTSVTKSKLPKRTILSALMVLLLIPLTIYIGVFYLGDRKYYFISLLIILETMLPFFIIFEGRKPQARELVIISVLCAIAVAGRIAFVTLPQFKPVIALVIISGICLGGETGFLVGAITAFMSNFYFMQGPWTPWQMFAYGIIGFVSGLLCQKGILKKNKVQVCFFGFFATIILCGGILNFSSVVAAQAQITPAAILTSIIAGLPLDLIHGISTVFFLWFAFEPMCDKLERIKIKYGIME